MISGSSVLLDHAHRRRMWAEANLPPGDRARFMIAESSKEILALLEDRDRLFTALEKISVDSLARQTRNDSTPIAMVAIGLAADEALCQSLAAAQEWSRE